MSEDAAISLLSVGVDFGITQVVDGSGKVFQHYDWVRWWKAQGQVLVSV